MRDTLASPLRVTIFRWASSRNFGPLVVLASDALCALLYLNYWVTLRLSPPTKKSFPLQSHREPCTVHLRLLVTAQAALRCKIPYNGSQPVEACDGLELAAASSFSFCL